MYTVRRGPAEAKDSVPPNECLVASLGGDSVAGGRLGRGRKGGRRAVRGGRGRKGPTRLNNNEEPVDYFRLIIFDAQQTKV